MIGTVWYTDSLTDKDKPFYVFHMCRERLSLGICRPNFRSPNEARENQSVGDHPQCQTIKVFHLRLLISNIESRSFLIPFLLADLLVIVLIGAILPPNDIPQLT
jgi:hypothetical protein